MIESLKFPKILLLNGVQILDAFRTLNLALKPNIVCRKASAEHRPPEQRNSCGNKIVQIR